MNHIELLKTAGLAKDMTGEEVAALASIAEEQRFARGAEIIREDSKSRDLFVICKGRVSIRLSLPTEVGKEEIIYTMRDGQIFGELSLVDGSPRSATVRAEEEVITCQFDFKKLSALLDEKPRIGYLLMRNIASIISARVRNTNMLWRNSLIW
ncbi:MAG: cyclic nucleotide-binding domain-containing protein [Calditrichaeota bacterium]|nr:cyclic nucleotide-binding domain-containing protein [Calditrichota bacterium]